MIPSRPLVASILLAWLMLPRIAGAAEIRVLDAEDRDITLTDAPVRIVALAPHIVENLFAIGAGGRIVGSVDYSDYPGAAKSLPRVGGIGGVSAEAIVALRPDLVVLWGSGTPRGIRGALDQASIPYLVDEIRSFTEMKASFERLGRITGNSQQADAAIKEIDKALASPEAIDNSMDDAMNPVPRVFLQIWDQPLQSIGRDHLLNEVIEHCGAISLTANVSGLAPVISLERVLVDDPDLIIVESEAQGRHWQQWPELTAVREQRLVTIHPDLLHRPTLRLLQGMRAICTEVRAASATQREQP